MLTNDDLKFLAGLHITPEQIKTQPTATPVSVREVQVYSIPEVDGHWVRYEDALQMVQSVNDAERRRRQAEHDRREAEHQAEENRRYMRIALAVAGFWLLFAGYMAVRG